MAIHNIGTPFGFTSNSFGMNINRHDENSEAITLNQNSSAMPGALQTRTSMAIF